MPEGREDSLAGDQLGLLFSLLVSRRQWGMGPSNVIASRRGPSWAIRPRRQRRRLGGPEAMKQEIDGTDIAHFSFPLFPVSASPAC